MNLFQSTYFVDKISNTFADNLAAFGLAFVLNAIADGRAKIHLQDQGSVFSLTCEPAIEPVWIEQRSFFAGAPFLVTVDNRTQQKMIKGTSLALSDLPEHGGNTVVDYEVERRNNEAFFAWYKALPRDDRRKVMRGELQGAPPPHQYWDVFRAVNPAMLQSYNALLAEWWRARSDFAHLLKILLQMACQTPNDLAGAEQAWAQLCKGRGWKCQPATAIQLLNPTQGKGINSPKAVWSAPNNLKGFWLLEWLKVVGFFSGGITRNLANSKDRKTYILMPVNLEWGKHLKVMKDFRRAMSRSETAIKMDILAALRYTQAFLMHYEGAKGEDLAAELFSQSPADLVSGMQMAFYKNLGNAIATMNIAAINLPRWVAPGSAIELAQLQEALIEHVSVVSGLDERRGDQYVLLNHYRDFLSANDLGPFFEFTTAYSGLIISQRERGNYVRQFTTNQLEVLFMNNDDNPQTFSQIVQDAGFRNVAYAIRHSTVVPQSRKGHGDRPAVEIRYGLGQQLARKAAYPADFLAELNEFLQLYNAENAQLREKSRNPFRKDVTTADIEAVTLLVDRFGSKVVCNMLVAYGYAREPKEPSQGEISTTGEPEVPETLTEEDE
ncbi:MAG: hypothetical protein A2W36_02420 [Chloroflexi bacterium RBG_16_58_14]|nr:MAG: hypothetical protein A2W36_02420 [Chloroflexi bacterium RBG_16_58_14]